MKKIKKMKSFNTKPLITIDKLARAVIIIALLFRFKKYNEPIYIILIIAYPIFLYFMGRTKNSRLFFKAKQVLIDKSSYLRVNQTNKFFGNDVFLPISFEKIASVNYISHMSGRCYIFYVYAIELKKEIPGLDNPIIFIEKKNLPLLSLSLFPKPAIHKLNMPIFLEISRKLKEHQ